MLPKTIPVTVEITIQIEQRAGARRVVQIGVGSEVGIKTKRTRPHRCLHRHRLVFAVDGDFLTDVVAQAQRTTQRNFLRCVATDHRIFHGEISVGHFHRRGAAHLHPHRLQILGQHIAGEGDIGKIRVNPVNVIVLHVAERQPARLGFLDHIKLDAANHRQAFAFEFLVGRLHRGIVGGRLGIPVFLTEIGVGDQHGARRTFPLLQPVGPAADRIGHDVIGVLFHHLTRHDG